MVKRHIWALIRKDLRLDGRAIALAQAGGLSLLALAFYLRPSGPDGREGLIFNLNFLAVLLWSDWLVSREKIKGTVQWLRTLPLHDGDLVVAKFAAQALWTIVFWLSSSLLFAGDAFYPNRLGAWCVSLSALLAFGSLAVAARWRFHQKVGQLLPLVAVALPMMLVVLVNRNKGGVTQTLVRLWGTGQGKALIAGVLVGSYIAVAWVTARWVSRSDTYQLIE